MTQQSEQADGESAAPAAPTRRPTVKQVAAHAGVSHQTVSRYLRGDQGMKPATIARIEQAVRELDYRPDLVARSMRTGRTRVLAVLLPSPVQALPTPTLAAAAEVAHQAGYFMEVAVVDGGTPERVERARDLLGSGRVDGVLSMGALPGLEERPRTPEAAALVVHPQFDDRLRGLGALADGSVVAEAVEHLAGLGHRDFLHIAGPEEWASARSRRRVYEEAVARLGLTSHGVVSPGAEWDAWGPRSGYDAVAALPLDSPVTAVIAANDNVALGAIRAAGERGWAVPGRLSVVGWDDAEFGRYATPTLSTVAVDRSAQGRYAMRRLISLVAGEEPVDAPEQLNRLVLRESTGPAPARPGRPRTIDT
ncbi:LacI family DNA-binding transcriptional regulator [Zhihengliuella alba]|uniref:LacI family DNA-binding transcriptional regulator n=1 Tax=Zhihengliuella alba TaxID=547018 RepID=A0ABP7DG43_9MICC